MKTTKFISIIMILVVIGAFITSATGYSQDLNNTIVYEANGPRSFIFSRAKGSYVALHFLLKTDCSYCMRHTHEFLVREREVPGVYHVFLKPDDDEQITVWKGKMEALVLKTDSLNSYISPIIYRDPNAGLARSFAVKPGYAFHNQVVNYPAMVILDPDGKEVFRYTGKSNADRLPFDKFAEKMTELRKTSK